MLLFLLFLAMLFLFLVFPLWMMIDCVISQERKIISKVLWIIFILLSWVLGSLVYGLLGSRKVFIQWLSGIIFAVGFLSIFLFVNFLYQTSHMVASDSIKRAATLQAGDLTQERIDQMKNNLLILRQELNDAKGFKAIYFIKDTYKDLMLNQIFILMMKDGQIQSIEYDEWTKQFDNRRQLDAKKLGEYLKSLQQEQK